MGTPVFRFVKMTKKRGESRIYEGRVLRYEIEEKINLWSDMTCFSSSELDDISVEELTTILTYVRSRINRVEMVIAMTCSAWKNVAFGSYSIPTSHNGHGSAYSQQFLVESGNMFMGPQQSTRASDILKEQSTAMKKHEEQQKYDKGYTDMFSEMQRLFSEADNLSRALINDWVLLDKNEKNVRLNNLIQKTTDWHNHAVDLILEYLPGRTFLNKL